MGHEDGVAKIKNEGICERFAKGNNKKRKYCTEGVGSVEQKISPSSLGLPSMV